MIVMHDPEGLRENLREGLHENLPNGLSSTVPAERLTALAGIYAEACSQQRLPEKTEEVNNHVHSIYSFSPYTPSQIAYMAWKAGLRAVGIMDHDSFSGAGECVEACNILGIASTCGLELRVSAEGTFLHDTIINNPGSPGIFYMAIHGIALKNKHVVEKFLKPINEARNRRNKEQLTILNGLLSQHFSWNVDFQTDVYAMSMARYGGSITERHILAALARKLMLEFGRGNTLIGELEHRLSIGIDSVIAQRLADDTNPHYLYDLLGLLKSHFLPAFFIQPGKDECIPAQQAVNFAHSIGAIPAYAYLGDVSESPTGDKKTQRFEDSFLEELFAELKRYAFQAVTFMPPRNSRDQLKRLMELCRRHGLMQISGVDINSSRQSFRCPEVLLPAFKHLNESTWALIAHEKLNNAGEESLLFSRDPGDAQDHEDDGCTMDARIAHYAAIGRSRFSGAPAGSHAPADSGVPADSGAPADSHALEGSKLSGGNTL